MNIWRSEGSESASKLYSLARVLSYWYKIVYLSRFQVYLKPKGQRVTYRLLTPGSRNQP